MIRNNNLKAFENCRISTGGQSLQSVNDFSWAAWPVVLTSECCNTTNHPGSSISLFLFFWVGHDFYQISHGLSHIAYGMCWAWWISSVRFHVTSNKGKDFKSMCLWGFWSTLILGSIPLWLEMAPHVHPWPLPFHMEGGYVIWCILGSCSYAHCLCACLPGLLRHPPSLQSLTAEKEALICPMTCGLLTSKVGFIYCYDYV